MSALTVAVLGGGSFGTAITWALLSSGHAVRLWTHRQEQADAINATGRQPSLPECDISGVHASADVRETLEGAACALVVCPSFGVAGLAAGMADAVPDELPVCILSKGLDPASGSLLIDVVAQHIGHRQRIAVLSGPNHAEELSRGAYAGAVVACEDIEVARYFQELISSGFFRLYISGDPVGVSLCGAAKNVIAIACGMARGKELGDNAVALLMTRGIQEIFRLVKSCGGKQETCLGLAGIGDLSVTCGSPHSRNGAYGEAFSREGVSVSAYEQRRHMVVEGAHAVGPLLALAAERGIEMPIMEAVGRLLAGEDSIDNEIQHLMGRELKVECW